MFILTRRHYQEAILSEFFHYKAMPPSNGGCCFIFVSAQGPRRELNPWPSSYQEDALPSELRGHFVLLAENSLT